MASNVLLLAVVIVIVIGLVIGLVVLLLKGKRPSANLSEKEKGVDDVKSIYLYLVLFATLMMTIGGGVSVFMSLADIVSPAPYHQSFEEYRQWNIDFEDGKKVEKKSEEELRVSYDLMIKNEQDQAMNRSINTLIKSFGWIIIPLPIFIYFYRKVPKRE